MRRDHTLSSWAMLGAVVVLALLQTWWAWGDAELSTSSTTLAPFTVLAALALASLNCLEARLAIVLVATAQLGLITLALTLGLPGEVRHPLDLQAAAAVVVPTSVLVLVELDRRARRTLRARRGGPGHPFPEAVPPYAR